MLNIIYSEILKLKKSNSIFMILLAAFGMTVLMNAAVIFTKDRARTFESYSYNIGQSNTIIIFSMIFYILGSYIFVREYNDRTANTLYSYPFCRIKIFIGKLLVIYMIIAAVYAFQCAAIYLSYYKLFGVIEKEQIVINIKANFYSMLFLMSSIPFVIFLGNLKKNIMAPIGYGILTVIINGLSDNRYISNIKYNPFIGAVSVMKYFYMPKDLHDLQIENIATASIIFFIISLSACIYQFYKMDIN